MDYTLIRSSRRTLAIQIDRECRLIVRAPRLYPVYLIERFIESKKSWIEKHRELAESRRQRAERKIYSDREISEMKKRLMEYLIHRVPELWQGKNLPQYTSIKVTKSDKRWGSCSGKNGLCFSYRLAEWLQGPPVKGGCPIGQGGFTQEYKNQTPLPPLTGGLDSALHSPFIDAVIIHEIAHLREKHHQPAFWKLVYEMMPEYKDIMQHQKNLD